MSLMRMPCSKNNNNTHHTRHKHTYTHTLTDCRLVGFRIWCALFLASFFMTLFLTLLARLASSCLGRRRRRTLLLLPLAALITVSFSPSPSLSLSLSVSLLRCHMFALLSPVRSESPVTTLTVILTVTIRAISAAKPLTYKVTMLHAAPRARLTRPRSTK